MFRSSLPLLLLLAVACNDRPSDDENPSHDSADVSSTPTPIYSDTVSAATTQIQLPDGRTVVVPLVNATFHGEIGAFDGSRWLLVSGIECNDCDASEQLFLFDAAADRHSALGDGFPFPGAYTEAGIDEQPFFRSRTFVGQCLTERAAGVVWLQEETDSTSTWRNSVRFVIPQRTTTDSIMEWNAELEESLLRNVDGSMCREIPGKEQFVL